VALSKSIGQNEKSGRSSRVAYASMTVWFLVTEASRSMLSEKATSMIRFHTVRFMLSDGRNWVRLVQGD